MEYFHEVESTPPRFKFMNFLRKELLYERSRRGTYANENCLLSTASLHTSWVFIWSGVTLILQGIDAYIFIYTFKPQTSIDMQTCKLTACKQRLLVPATWLKSQSLIQNSGGKFFLVSACLITFIALIFKSLFMAKI